MRLIKAFFIGLTTVLFLEFFLVSCTKEPPPPLRIGTVVWPGFECLYLARDLGYYKDTEIRLVEYNATPEVTRAFRNWELEAIAYTVPEALSLVAAEPSIQAVLATRQLSKIMVENNLLKQAVEPTRLFNEQLVKNVE